MSRSGGWSAPKKPTPPAVPPGLRTYAQTLYEHSISGDNLDDDVEVEVRPILPAVAGASRPMPLHGYRGASDIPGLIKLVRGAVGHGANVYNGIHLRRRGSTRGGDESVAVLTALVCDIDCDKAGITRAAAIAAVEGSPFGAPTMTVWSGGGIHGYWVYNERVEATADSLRIHRLGCAYLRHYLQDRLGSERAADDMSSADRILRTPGSFNVKPERVDASGNSPAVELVTVRESHWIDIADVPDVVPAGFDANAHAGVLKRRFGPSDSMALPTSVPDRIRRILAQAAIPFRVAKHGDHITAIKLLPCPACGQSDGGCYLTPKSGTLRTYHSASCPAAHWSGGIPLDEWVARYAPDARATLDAPAPPSPSQVARATRLAHAISGFAPDPTPDAVAHLSDTAKVGLTFAEAVFVSRPQVAGMPATGPNALPVSIAKAAPESGDVLLPMRDAKGDVRQAVWLASGEHLPARLAFARGDDGVAGEFMVLGHMPHAAALAAKGPPLYLAFGAADYLAALGLVAEIEEQAAVLGIIDAQPAIFDHLVAAWVAAKVRPSRVVVLRSPACDDAALKRLDGTAGTVAIDFPAGLDASLKGGSQIVNVKRRVRSAPWLYRPPVHILSAEAAIAADIRSAVIYAANTSTDERQTLVVYCLPPGGGKSTAAQIIAGDVATGCLTVPVRGKRPKAIPASQWPPLERAVAFATPNHPLADEKYSDHIDRLHIAAPAERFKGALEYCHFRKRVEPAYSAVGRRGICGDAGHDNRCELADTCQGAVVPSASRGSVAYVTHAMARYLKLDFAFVDEDTGVIATTSVTDAMVATFYRGAPIPRVRSWREVKNPEAPAVAEMLGEIFAPLAHEHARKVGAGKVEPYPRRIEGNDLCRLIEGRKNLVALMQVALSGGATKPPTPMPNELRAGSDIHRHMPSTAAWVALVALNEFFRRVRKLDEEPNALPMFTEPKSPSPIVSLVLEPVGTWALEVRSIKPLPKCPAVLLDATGELTLAEYKAAYPHFSVAMRSMQLWGASPRASIHVKTRSVARGALFAATGSIRPEATTRIRNMLARVVSEVRMASVAPRAKPISIGLLTYRAIHDYIEGLRPGGGVLSTLKSTLRAEGVDLLTGYYGRDDRGTNRFQQVDGIAIIGDARMNLGTVESDCLLLGLEPGDVLGDRAEAVVTQAIFRARHTRRMPGSEPVVLLASARAPAIPGLVWSVEPLPMGDQGTMGACYDAVAFVASELGVIGPKVIELFPWREYDRLPADWHHRDLDDAGRAFLANVPHWRRYEIDVPHVESVVIWAADAEAAEVWAVCNLGTPRIRAAAEG